MKKGLPNRIYGGGHFTPGFWLPDKSSGKIAVPEGPQQPLDSDPAPTVSASDARRRDQRTAENLAAKQSALAPRRYGQ